MKDRAGMTKETLQEAINNKANANVQKRVQTFRDDISAACARLWGRAIKDGHRAAVAQPATVYGNQPTRTGDQAMTTASTEIHAIDHNDYLAAMRSMDEAREHLDTLERKVSESYYALEYQLEELRRQLKSSRAEIGRAKTTIHSAYHKRREPEKQP